MIIFRYSGNQKKATLIVFVIVISSACGRYIAKIAIIAVRDLRADVRTTPSEATERSLAGPCLALRCAVRGLGELLTTSAAGSVGFLRRTRAASSTVKRFEEGFGASP